MVGFHLGRYFFPFFPLQPFETPRNRQRKAWKNLDLPREVLEEKKKCEGGRASSNARRLANDV
jgi:hypothetical protein